MGYRVPRWAKGGGINVYWWTSVALVEGRSGLGWVAGLLVCSLLPMLGFTPTTPLLIPHLPGSNSSNNNNTRHSLVNIFCTVLKNILLNMLNRFDTMRVLFIKINIIKMKVSRKIAIHPCLYIYWLNFLKTMLKENFVLAWKIPFLFLTLAAVIVLCKLIV